MPSEIHRIIQLIQNIHIAPSYAVLAKLVDDRLEHVFRLGAFAAPGRRKGFDFNHRFDAAPLYGKRFGRACCFATLDSSALSIGHASTGSASREQISISLVNACDMALNALILLSSRSVFSIAAR